MAGSESERKRRCLYEVATPRSLRIVPPRRYVEVPCADGAAPFIGHRFHVVPIGICGANYDDNKGALLSLRRRRWYVLLIPDSWSLLCAFALVRRLI